MKSKLINHNLGREQLSDETLIQQFLDSEIHDRIYLYEIMAKRSNDNLEVMKLLFKEILDIDRRNQVLFGMIKRAWIPAVSILWHGNLELKKKLKIKLSSWSQEEIDSFLFYIKKDSNNYQFLISLKH